MTTATRTENLLAVPSCHFSPPFAQQVRRAVEAFAPTAIALEVPAGALADLEWAVGCWPSPVCAVVEGAVFPFVPGDSILEAARLGLRAGVGLHAVDAFVRRRPGAPRQLPDPALASRLAVPFQAAVEAVSARPPHLRADVAREAHMARALRALVPLLRSVRGRDVRGDYANLAAEMLQIPARRIWAAVEGKAGLEAAAQESLQAARARPSKFKEPWKGSGKPWQGPGSNARAAQRPPASFDPGPNFDPGFDPGFDPSFDPDFSSDFVPPGDPSGEPGPAWEIGADPAYAPGPGPRSDRSERAERSDRAERAGSSQFSAAMPHSAAMRPVQPLPTGQASVTALLVDRPELARVAEREGVLDSVTDQRLHPILARVIKAALEGESIPSEGELLELVDPSQHRMLHDRVFAHEYLEIEDPQTALEQSLLLCERDRLEHEVRTLDQTIAQASSRGDSDSVHELIIKRMAARQRKEELQRSLRRN